MNGFKKLKPDKNPFFGCLNCGGGEMKWVKDGRIVLRLKTALGSKEWEKWVLTSDCPSENNLDFDRSVRNALGDKFCLATLDKWIVKYTEDNAHDFRATLYTPIRTAVYQRQAPKEWVLVESY